MLRALLELCRISNLPTVWTNVIAAWVIAGGGWHWHPHLAWLLVGASLMYSAGMILNDTWDVAWDREKRPERPIPSGRISLKAAWAIGIGGLLGGYALMVLAGGAGWGITAALMAAIVLYDVYHKPWAGSVVVMGACRALLYAVPILPAQNAATGLWPHTPHGNDLSSVVFVAGITLGVYVVALTLIARAEGKGSMGQNHRNSLTALLMLPAAWAGVLAILTVIQPHLRLASLLAIGAPLAFFIAWTLNALRQMRKGGPSIGQAVGLLLAGIPLVDAINISLAEPATALAFCLLPPLLRYWQRWVAAT